MWFILAGLLITICNPISNYIFGELSIFNSYLFAFSYFFLSFFFTCTKRTESARFLTLLLVIIECILENCLLKQTIYQSKDKLITIIWLLRYFFILTTVLTLAYFHFKYHDFNQKIHEKLELIKNQNLFLIEMFSKYQTHLEVSINFQQYLRAHYDNYKKQKFYEHDLEIPKLKSINNHSNKYFY